MKEKACQDQEQGSLSLSSTGVSPLRPSQRAAYALSVSERLSDSPELSGAEEQTYKEGTLLCARQQRGLVVPIACGDQSCMRI